MRLRYGIDVSENNVSPDWEAIKAAGISFAMVRCSWGKSDNKDTDFEKNVAGAHAVGLEVGAYHYSYAKTPADAVQEARSCREIIDKAGVLLELPVFFDMEDADGRKARHGFNFTRENVTAICREFLNHIRLDCGVYASKSWLDNYIDWRSLGCAVWNAEWMNGWNPTPNIAEDTLQGYMWQYTDKKYIAGKYYDGDVLYVPD